MEIADIFVVNKADQDGADRAEREIVAMQALGSSGRGRGLRSGCRGCPYRGNHWRRSRQIDRPDRTIRRGRPAQPAQCSREAVAGSVQS